MKRNGNRAPDKRYRTAPLPGLWTPLKAVSIMTGASIHYSK